MREREEKHFKTEIIILIILATGLVVRSFFSFCQTDESFYAALINRLWNGEKLIQDEWHRAQFYAPLLLPFYGAYISLQGSSEGVILFLRILYIIFALITSLKLFSLVFRESSDPVAAGIAAAITMLFSRANISGVSYYNLCMLCAVSAFCSIENAGRLLYRKKLLSACWGGVLLACAVLCNPFLAPFVLAATIISLLNRRSRPVIRAVIIGITGMAFIYCLYLLRVTGVQGILRFLPFVLQNSEQMSISDNLLFMLKEAARYSRYVAVPALAMSVAVALDKSGMKKAKQIRGLYLFVQAILLGVSAVRTISGINGIVLFVLTVVAFPFWLEAWKEKQPRTARQLYSFGIVNAVAFSAASNTGLDAGTVGFCISGIGGIWLIRETLFRKELSNPEKFYNQNRTGKVEAKLVFTIITVVVLMPLLCQRLIGVYRDAPLWELNTKLEQGPAKGLYTTQLHAEQYESICDSLAELEKWVPEGRILYCKNLPWAYLMTGYQYGTCSPWRVYTQELETYCAVRPENRPDYICVLNEKVGGWEKSPFHNNPARENPNSFDYEGDFWTQVEQCPVLTESEWLCVYDVRQLMQD